MKRLLVALMFFGCTGVVWATDPAGKWSSSPLKPWFDQLKSGRGLCCSVADGMALEDVDWESEKGQYKVLIDGVWWPVPPDAVIAEPNRVGRAMVWPVRSGGPGVGFVLSIRCFLPGAEG